ncbi:15239_t:CDS:2 [Acaulospora colombiana]|uniref:15239_t:CDS:1 n=1 Tax=Acaulospora colombiana TaxID=27376 RepID=A0ACA9LXJ7_9GLOM|nr:15239_t:CDS:2 [Acaulospora colombiana]
MAAFAVILTIALHGSSALKVFLIIVINYTIAKRLAGSTLGNLIIWIVNLVILFANEIYDGYNYSSIHSAFAFLSSVPLNVRQRASHSHPQIMYNFVNYLAYTLYSPLYIAGPIMTFNDFIWQMRRPINIDRKSVLGYALRFVVCLLTMELILHYMYVVAIKDTKSWYGATPMELSRYIYVPLGGSANVILATLVSFTFVALWHDLKLRLLAWGWLVTLFVIPELVLSKASPGHWGRWECTYAHGRKFSWVCNRLRRDKISGDTTSRNLECTCEAGLLQRHSYLYLSLWLPLNNHYFRMWIFDWFWDILAQLGERLNGVISYLLLTGVCFCPTKVWRTRMPKSSSLGLTMLEKPFVHRLFSRANSVLTAVLGSDAAPHAEERPTGHRLKSWLLARLNLLPTTWEDTNRVIHAIVFMVDTADVERLPESKAELDALLSIEELSKVPFVIFGNKIDAPGAVSEDQLRHALGVFQTTGKVNANPFSETNSANIRCVSVDI